MRVAVVAGVGRVLVGGWVGVAGRAGDLAFTTMIEREGMIKDHILPTAGHMATRTVGTKLTEVFLRFSVATHTGGGGALIDLVLVASGTFQLDVCASQREGCAAMVKRHLRPA